jgi:ankyrin repeat protein
MSLNKDPKLPVGPVSLLLEVGVRPSLNLFNIEKTTPIRDAIAGGRMNALKLLLPLTETSAGLTSPDAWGRYALHDVSLLSNQDMRQRMVQKLLESGADVNAIDIGTRRPCIYCNRQGRAASYLTITARHERISTMIIPALHEISKCCLHLALMLTLSDDTGSAAVHIASEYPSAEPLERLLQWRKQEAHAATTRIMMRNNMGRMPWHRAAASGRKVDIDLLLGVQADVSARDSADSTALHLAVHSPYRALDVVLTLLQARSDVNNVNDGGLSVLDDALCSTNSTKEQAVKVLTASGAKSAREWNTDHMQL